MKTLLLLSALLIQTAAASDFIVEMKRPLTSQEIAQAKKLGLFVSLFDRTQTDYFKRTYNVGSPSEEKIKASALPVKLIEQIHQAFFTGLSPAKNPSYMTPDQFFHFQWGLLNQGQVISKLIGSTKLKTIQGKPGVDIRWKDSIGKIEASLKKTPVVAVIDMGIDYSHPDLKSQIYRNEKECDENGNIVDREEDLDNNGLVGDCMGWNFAGRNMFEARRPMDDSGHGTHVSGIIAATASNKIGVSGVSSKIKILPIRVTGAIDESKDDRRRIQPMTDRIAKGILYAANMGVDVINLSMGWTKSMDTRYLNEAIGHALSRGIVIVAAAGNNNNNASIVPCSGYDVICVGAASIDGSLADFSNYGGEVDVLAPGEEIFSTVPVRFVPMQYNFQGYDIMSGTSQAAPFVSALAALMKGVDPSRTRDEINRRIVESADPGRANESQAGMINMKRAFEIESAPSVRPIFKKFSIAFFEASSTKFTYALRVKNFGAEGKNISFKVSSLSPALALDQSFSFEALRPGEVQALRLAGDVVDFSAHNQVKLSVSINVDGVEKSYQHEFRLVRDILKDNDVKTLPFAFAASVLPVGKVEDAQVRNLINTVETLHAVPESPEFYLPRLAKDSMELKFFRRSAETYQEVPGTIKLPEATQLLNVMKLDLNYDGIEDYLLRAVACEKNCDDAQKAERYIQYSLWKKDLTPLFGEKSFWKFLPTIANVNLKSQRFLRLETQEFGAVAVPVFVEAGNIPDLQQEILNSFTLPDRNRGRRIYYLSPKSDSTGKVIFNTLTVSTPAFLKKLKVDAGEDENDEIQAVALLAQSRAELATGQVDAVFAIGRGFGKKNLVVRLLDETKVPPKSFVLSQNIWGFEHQPSLSLENETVDDAFIGLVSKSQITMLQTGLQKIYAYSSGATAEVPLGAIASFHKADESFTFFQTPSYLMLARRTGTETSFEKLKINRFSFLPGILFSDSFYPIMTQDNGVSLPGLYVDETDIQSDMVSVTVFDGKDLKSPIGKSSYVPPICKAMNPVRLNQNEGHSFSLLCLENRQWVMKFKEIR